MKDKLSLYKGKHFIVFYDIMDELFLYSFDNVKDILRFQNKEINRANINSINVALYQALHRESNTCRFLNGTPMKVYIIDVN